MTSRRAAILAAGALALALAGCGSAATPTPEPVSAKFANGLATVSLTGDYTVEYVAPFLTGRLAADGTFLSVEYGIAQTGALTYQGPATPGAYPTLRTADSITTLSLTAVLPSGEKRSDSFASLNGECTITIVRMGVAGGNATFTCTDLANIDGTATVDVTGEFYLEP